MGGSVVDEAGVARPCESGSGVTGTAFDREQEQIATSSPVIAIPGAAHSSPMSHSSTGEIG